MAVQSYGRDVNQLTNSQFPRVAVELSEPFFSAIVEDVVVNERGGKILRYNPDGNNIGQILFRAIPQDRNLDNKKLPSAFPLSLATLEFPLVGEQVMIFRTMGGLYYTNRVNTTNLVSDSISTTMTVLSRPTQTSAEATDTRRLAKIQIERPTAPQNRIDTFIAASRARPIRASPGDTIIQGRYGNTIRLGSNLFESPTVNRLSPNIIMTAGQWASPTQVSTPSRTLFSSYYENINNDRSSIWMLADQLVPFVPVTANPKSKNSANLRSSEMRTTEYSGAQIFISSDRVILNSKNNEVSLFAKTEINLSALKSITLDTESSIFLSANNKIDIQAEKDIILRGRKILISSTEDLSYKTSGNYTIVGKKIFIGRYGDTSQPVVLGGTLSLWLQAFLRLLLSPGAIQTMTGPAIFNPAVQVGLTRLQRQLGSTSRPQNAAFNSKDNFTSETNPV